MSHFAGLILGSQARLEESALYVARADDPAVARQQCAAIFDQILAGLSA